MLIQQWEISITDVLGDLQAADQRRGVIITRPHLHLRATIVQEYNPGGNSYTREHLMRAYVGALHKSLLCPSYYNAKILSPKEDVCMEDGSWHL